MSKRFHAEEKEFIAVPGPKLLEAIGTVAVKWSALEFLIDNLLFWASDPAGEDIGTFINRKGVQQRCDKLKTILRTDHAKTPGTQGLIELIDKVLAMKNEREQVIHGLYLDPASSKTNADAILINLKSHKQKTEWPITRLRVLTTAKKIDQLCNAISLHLINHGKDIGGGTIWSITWRHKDRIEQ
jgi:hypothetical protein